MVRAAGTNCDRETMHALACAGAEPDLVYIDDLKERRRLDYQIMVLPGGFTYGDDIAAGKILANEIQCAMRDQMLDFIGRGNLLLGICNGFQVLVKCGILPGLESGFATPSVTLVLNDSERFEDRWVYLKVNSANSVFTRGLPTVITLPVAHGEGKFVTKDDTVLEGIKPHITFRYVDPSGNAAGYPWNPNGSQLDIAGIADPSGRILGLMPHPERYVSRRQHPEHTRRELPPEGDGLAIFRNAVEYFRT